MTVVGEAFVAVSPISAGFGSKLQAQLAGSGFAGNVEKQMANAGVLGGNAFTKKIQGALSAAGISGGQALGAAVVLGAVAGLAKIGEEFQKAEHQIQQQTGATGAALEGLADTVTRSFRAVPVSLGAAATAVDELFRRGVPLGKQLDVLAKQELFLAKVTKEDLGQTVEATTGLMQKFNVPIADQSRELDVLFKAYQNSGKSLSELTSNLQKAGGVLQSFGFSLDKSAALLSSLEKAGVNLGPALAGLRLAFGKIVSEGGDPQKVLANLIHEFSDGTPKAKAMADAIALFGKRSGAELSIAISKGKFDVDALLKSITDGRGGIIATGLATLTLGDQIRLFANNATADLAKLGTAVLQGLERTFADVGPPILDLIRSSARLVEVAAPLAVVFLPLVNALRLVGPLTAVFAEGVTVVAHGLDLLPPPAVLAAAALGAILFTSEALAASLIRVGARLAFVAVEFAIAHPAIAAAVAVIATLGIVSKLVSTSIDPAIKAAKDFGAAAFDAGNKSGVFKEGLTSVRGALTQFIADQSATGKLAGTISDALKGAGSNVKLLASAVSGGDDQWKRYKASLIDAAKAADPLNNNNLQVSRSVQQLSIDLDTQRRAFQLANKDELTNAVILGQISPKLETHIKNLHRSKDGTVDFGAAVDDLNKRLSAQAKAHDTVVLAADSTAVAEQKLTAAFAAGSISEADVTSKLKGLGLSAAESAHQLAVIKDQAIALNQSLDLTASRTVPATAAYGQLTRQIAQGTITQHEAVAQLRAMGFSLEGAGTAFSDLQGQVKSFIDGAVGQLPTVAQAISDFASQITSDEQQLASDKKAGVDLREKLDEAIAKSSASTQQKLSTINLTILQDQQKIALGSVGTTDKLQRDLLRRSQIIAGSGQASDTLRAEIEKNNAAIIADNKKLADDNNPNKFTQNLLENAAKIVSFTANLQKLVSLGLAPLAAELAKQGPDAAAGLAAGLAAAPAKAVIAEKAVELGKTASDNFRKFLEDNAPELIGTGAKQGLVIGKAIADGITKELLNNFPFLRQIGITTGDQLIGGAKEGADKSTITDAIKARLGKHIPEFRGLGVPIGTNVMDGAAEGVGRRDVANIIASQLAHGGGKLREAGIGLGNALDEGVSAGIILNQFKVGEAIITMTQYGTTVAANQWRIKSPSQVFAALGREVPAGVALGITSNLAVVGGALTGLSADFHTVQTQIAQDGYNIGAAVGDGVAAGIRARFESVSEAMLSMTQHGVAVVQNQWRIQSPSQVFAAIGREVPAGLAQGITSNVGAVGAALDGLATDGTSREKFHPALWLQLGVLAGQGIAAGIRSQIEAVGAAVTALTQHGVAVANDQWKVTSPSKVFAAIGVEVGAGLAVGIASSSANVEDATRGLASRATASIESALASVSVAPGVVKPIEVDARIGPIAPPVVAPVTIAASVRVPADPVNVDGRVSATVAPIAPLSLDAIVTPAAIDPVVVPASFGPLPTPNAPTVLIHGSFAPVPPPSIPPVQLSVSVPTLDPVTLAGTVNVSPPSVPDVIVPATLAPLPTPTLQPITVQTTLGPLAQPTLDPITISARVGPVDAPVVPPVVVPARLSNVEIPRIAPVVAPVVIPPIAPVTVQAALSALVVPPLPSATIDATVTPTVQPIDATPVGRRLGETVASGVGEGVKSAAISDRLNAVATDAAASSSASFRDAGLLLGSRLSDSVRNVAVVDPDRTPGQGLLEGFDRNADQLRAHMSALAAFLDGFTFVGKLENQFASITDAKTTAGFVTFAANLVDTFHQSFEKISVDAGQLQKVLDALTEQHTGRASALSSELLAKLQAEKLLVPKFAPPQPPSNVTFHEQAQSIQVPRPEDRANAQTPRDAPLVFHATFNEKIDPLHVAAEIAWQLL